MYARTPHPAPCLYKNYDIVVWWATPVEIASAFAHLLRLKQIDLGDGAQARALAQTLADSWSMIHPSQDLRDKAVRLVERSDLRAADALQLAAALAWCEGDPSARFPFRRPKAPRRGRLAGFDIPQL